MLHQLPCHSQWENWLFEFINLWRLQIYTWQHKFASLMQWLRAYNLRWTGATIQATDETTILTSVISFQCRGQHQYWERCIWAILCVQKLNCLHFIAVYHLEKTKVSASSLFLQTFTLLSEYLMLALITIRFLTCFVFFSLLSSFQLIFINSYLAKLNLSVHIWNKQKFQWITIFMRWVLHLNVLLYRIFEQFHKSASTITINPSDFHHNVM